MPRTVNVAEHTVRRDAFVDAAQRLIQEKGYEEMSVQDVLDALETSRGAFYHYFDSKQALLEAVVERFADGAMAAIQPIAADPRLDALAKFDRIFAGIASWKEERRDFVLRILEVWTSDANAIVREKLRRMSTQRLTPLLSQVVQQGLDEGVFTAAPAEQTAAVLVALLLGLQELATELFVARQAGAVAYDEVVERIDGFTRAYERVLGAAPGSLAAPDERMLKVWFG